MSEIDLSVSSGYAEHIKTSVRKVVEEGIEGKVISQRIVKEIGETNLRKIRIREKKEGN